MILSKYTQEIYEIVNSLTFYNSDKTLFERVDLANEFIFDFDYPIWTPAYKTTLERKIIFRYLKKEICCETLELWKMMLYERLNTIMPYYNQLYQSTLKEYDFTKDHYEITTDTRTKTDTITSTGNDTINGTVAITDNDTLNSNIDVNGSNKLVSASNGTNTTDNSIIDCDTPQARIGGGDYASNMQEVDGVNTIVSSGTDTTTMSDTTINLTTNAKVSNTTNAGTNEKVLNATTVSNDVLTHTVDGNNVSISELILRYRDTILNIDNMICDDLYDLFMLIY